MSIKSENRLTEIYHYLKDVGYASISELASIFSVSVSTIKRDLDKLNEQKMVDRIHGGAMIINTENIPSYNYRKNLNIDEKRRIGKAAADLIEENDVIYIDTGSTCYELYTQIHAKNVTLFTINVPILSFKNPSISRLFVLEGEFFMDLSAISGILTIENLSRINPSKLFFSTSVISNDYEIQCQNDMSSILYNKIVHMPGKKILLADASKIGLSDNFRVADLSQVDVFITDNRIKPSDVKAIRSLAPNTEIIIK